MTTRFELSPEFVKECRKVKDGHYAVRIFQYQKGYEVGSVASSYKGTGLGLLTLDCTEDFGDLLGQNYTFVDYLKEIIEKAETGTNY